MPLRSAAALTPARPNERCVVCGSQNPAGLRIRFSTPRAGQVAAFWSTSTDWEGFQGVIHGGIVSTVLDEAMSKAVGSNGCPGFTCELRVRFRRHVAAGECLQVRGWVVEKRKRRMDMEMHEHRSISFQPQSTPRNQSGIAARRGSHIPLCVLSASAVRSNPC